MNKRYLVINKKGDVQSLIIAIVIVMALALGAIIFSKVFTEITTEFQDEDKFSNRTIENIESVEEKTIPLLDFFIFFTLLSLMIGLIISSIYIDVHPALVIIFLIGIVVAVFLAGLFTNVFSEISAEPELEATAEEFTYTNLILGNHFPIIILVLGIIIVIILYGKSRGGGSRGLP